MDGQYYYNWIGRNAKFGGDQNGDGYDDVIIGDSRGGFNGHINATGRGYVHCHSGLDGSLLWLLDPGSTGDLFGLDISQTGDTNGDGADDFLVGAPAYLGSDVGYAHLYGASQSAHLLGLSTPDPVHAGSHVTHQISGAPQGTTVTLHAGSGRGPTYLQTGARLDIVDPIAVGTGVSNSGLIASIGTYVPSSLTGYRVWLQATAGIGYRSNVAYRVIQ